MLLLLAYLLPCSTWYRSFWYLCWYCFFLTNALHSWTVKGSPFLLWVFIDGQIIKRSSMIISSAAIFAFAISPRFSLKSFWGMYIVVKSTIVDGQVCHFTEHTSPNYGMIVNSHKLSWAWLIDCFSSLTTNNNFCLRFRRCSRTSLSQQASEFAKVISAWRIQKWSN